jgi:hypothetical protein
MKPIPKYVTVHPRRAHLNGPGILMLVLMAISTGMVTAWIYTIISLMMIGR